MRRGTSTRWRKPASVTDRTRRRLTGRLPWFDKRGQVVKSSSPGGLVQKVAYDGVGRTTTSYTTDGGGYTTWSDALTVTGDIVLSQDEMSYDSSPDYSRMRNLLVSKCI